MMKQYLLLFLIMTLVCSCQSDFEVDEFCVARSIIDGEYVIKMEGLALLENNEIPYETLDTMYFKVDKTTNYKFKLANKAEYEALQENTAFELESYVYLKRYPHPDKGAKVTIVQHQLPKYTDEWNPTICKEDITAELVQEIKRKLINEGYVLDTTNQSSTFEGPLKEAFIKFQKKHHLPHSRLDIKTLKTLGISIKSRK